MARVEEILHGLLDSLEEADQRTRERVRRYIASLDPVRLLDPTDELYDLEVRNSILGMLLEGAADAADEGARAIDAILGNSPGRPAPLVDRLEAGRAPFSGRALELAVNRVDNRLVLMGQGLDLFVAEQRSQGMSPEATLDAIERAILGLDPDTDDPTLRGNPLTEHVEALDRTTRRALWDTGTSSQIERTVELFEPSAEDIEAAAFAMQMTWVCALRKTCPDCLSRHGTSRPLEVWESRGLPGTGWSVCGGFCQCQLVASEVAGAGVDVLVRPSRYSQRGEGTTMPREVYELLRAEPSSEAARRARDSRLGRAYADDIEVRRALRLLGQQNARGNRGDVPRRSVP